ncbi:reticulon-like protein b4 [Phtheirospermum japonicum]|uniref:Reticulon-like protein b4 n=1 Tax=Phtheirospermum japonicum TaxID=374723 RepID=A0A830CWC8_9LAMI|nr:reticulon-like protein b4 [Phtheirospermum japonicum]
MDPEFSESSEDRFDDDDGQEEKFHLFGRQKPVHSALGGGKPADVILWRNKQISAGITSRFDSDMAPIRMDRLSSHPFHLPFSHILLGKSVPVVEPLLLR